jgi:LysM repeat protein
VAPVVSSARKTAIALAVMVGLGVGAVYQLSHLSGDDTAKRVQVRSAPDRDGSATTSPVPTTGATQRYQVQSGDTLTSIARRFGITVAAIVAANTLTDPDTLSLGQTLEIPPPPPVELVVSPTSVTAGVTVQFEFRGAKPGENVTFTLNGPMGTFTGPAHAASADGAVTASYTPAYYATPGDVTVSAVGDQGTTATASFRIESDANAYGATTTSRP